MAVVKLVRMIMVPTRFVYELLKRFCFFSSKQGNDLSTPRPELQFPGLKAGDQWCVCAGRWKEAAEAGCAPPVLLDATNEKALDVVSLADLEYHALAVE
jgi:uncharacterized protein (DUF2237 family)